MPAVPITANNFAWAGGCGTLPHSAAAAGVRCTRERSSAARYSIRAVGVSSGMPPVYIITTPETNQSTNSGLRGIPT